jgi:hypothetical protein
MPQDGLPPDGLRVFVTSLGCPQTVPFTTHMLLHVYSPYTSHDHTRTFLATSSVCFILLFGYGEYVFLVMLSSHLLLHVCLPRTSHDPHTSQYHLHTVTECMHNAVMQEQVALFHHALMYVSIYLDLHCIIILTFLPFSFFIYHISI